MRRPFSPDVYSRALGVTRDEEGVDGERSADGAMKYAVLERYGQPEDVVRCVEGPGVGPPGTGEVVFDVLAFPINPADVSMCKGSYRLRPTLPATPGAECVGRVTAVGAGVSYVKRGDLVITLQRENWAQQRRVKVDDVIAVPSGIRRNAAFPRPVLI